MPTLPSFRLPEFVVLVLGSTQPYNRDGLHVASEGIGFSRRLSSKPQTQLPLLENTRPCIGILKEDRRQWDGGHGV